MLEVFYIHLQQGLIRQKNIMQTQQIHLVIHHNCSNKGTKIFSPSGTNEARFTREFDFLRHSNKRIVPSLEMYLFL